MDLDIIPSGLGFAGLLNHDTQCDTSMDGTQASHLCGLAGLYQCEGKLPIVVGVPLCLGSRHVLPSDGDAEMTRRLDDRSAVALEKKWRQDLGFRI